MKPLRRLARLARGAARKGGILQQDVDRPNGEPARLAASSQRPGLSQRRIGGWNRSFHE